MVRGGNAHFSTYHTRIRSRETGENKTDEQTRTKLGVTKSRGRYCNTICMCGLSLAWVTSENSTMLLESDILRLFFTGPYLVSSPLCSGVWCWLPLRGSTPTSLFASLLSSLNCPPWSPAATAFCCLPLCSRATNSPLSGPATNSPLSCPTTNCLSWAPATNCLSWSPATNSQLPLSWVASSTLIRLPVPLPGTARFHVQESFVWFRAKTDNWIVCFGSLPP